MGKGSKAPAAPDPYKTASTEAQFNRFDTYSPSGSGVRQGYTDANGVFQQGVAPEGMQSAQSYIESPYEAAIRTSLEPASVALTGKIVNDSIINMPDAARVKDRGDVAKNIFDRSFSMMMPGIEKSNSRLIGNLQARGMPVGGAAFNDAYGAQQRETQDTISRLAMDADMAAGSEQSRLFGLDQAARGSAISELVAAMTGSYNPPNSTPGGTGAGVNYGGLVGQKYQADMAQYNQQQAQASSTASTLGGLGGAMLMKCSESFKDKHSGATVETLAEAVMHMPLYRWSYKPEHAAPGEIPMLHVGPMAEDFQRLTGLGDGTTIHVIDAVGVLMGALKDALLRLAAVERCLDRETVH